MPSEAEDRGRKLSTGAWRARNGRQTAPRRHPAECEHTEPTDLVDAYATVSAVAARLPRARAVPRSVPVAGRPGRRAHDLPQPRCRNAVRLEAADSPAVAPP